MNARTSPDLSPLVGAVLRSDLYSFIQGAFPIVSAGETLHRNWHLEAMSTALGRVMTGHTKRLIITVPPRHLKSICASVAFPAFLLGHDPTRRIICVSYSESLARKHANDCRALMRSPLYRHLFPGSRISAIKDTEYEFATTRGGYRLATSVGGTLTGRGGNLIIIDDPMKPQDAQSENARNAVWQWLGNTLLSRLDHKATDPIIVVMQRLHVDDLVGHLLEQEGWSVLNLPAIAEIEHRVPLRQGWDFVRHPGHVLHEEREPRRVLDELRRPMGSVDFAAQYQQDPVVPGGNMIQWSWFRSYEDAPQFQPGDRVFLSWDTAQSADDLASYSACVVILVRREDAYVVDVIRERLNYPDLKRRVLSAYQRWRELRPPARW